MLVFVAQHHHAEHLTGQIAVLTPPGDLIVQQIGHPGAERRRLGTGVDHVLPVPGGHRAQSASAVDQRHGASEMAGQGRSRCPGRVPSTADLIHCVAHPLGGTREQSHLLEDDHRGDGEHAESGTGWVQHRIYFHQRSGPIGSHLGQLPSPCHRHHTSTSPGGLGGGLNDLRGVAAGRKGEHQGLLVHIRRGLVALHHHDGQGHERTRGYGQQVAGEPARAHAQHQHVGNFRPVGQPLQLVAPVQRVQHLLGQPVDRRPHAQRVHSLAHRLLRSPGSSHGVKVKGMDSDSALAISRSCSESSTVPASSISMLGMSSSTA